MRKVNEKSLVPLLIIGGLVSAPLIFILGLVFGSQIQLSHILTADSLSSWVSAVATVSIAVLTFILSKETWYLRETQIEQVNELRKENIRPNVSVALKNSNISFNLMVIEVKNLGRGIARNIQFQFINSDNNKIHKSESPVVDAFLKMHIFSNGMHSLGIGQSVESYLFSFNELRNKLGEENIFSPYFTVQVSFEDVEGTCYRNELTIDFKEFEGISELGGGDPLHKISGDVKKLREQFERLTSSSFRRLHVNTYSSADRVKEREESEKEREEYRKKVEAQKAATEHSK